MNHETVENRSRNMVCSTLHTVSVSVWIVYVQSEKAHWHESCFMSVCCFLSRLHTQNGLCWVNWWWVIIKRWDCCEKLPGSLFKYLENKQLTLLIHKRPLSTSLPTSTWLKGSLIAQQVTCVRLTRRQRSASVTGPKIKQACKRSGTVSQHECFIRCSDLLSAWNSR